MMLGRLLGLSAILLQIIVFLQPLFPEKHSVFLVCKTVAVALDLEVTSAHPQHDYKNKLEKKGYFQKVDIKLDGVAHKAGYPTMLSGSQLNQLFSMFPKGSAEYAEVQKLVRMQNEVYTGYKADLYQMDAQRDINSVYIYPDDKRYGALPDSYKKEGITNSKAYIDQLKADEGRGANAIIGSAISPLGALGSSTRLLGVDDKTADNLAIGGALIGTVVGSGVAIKTGGLNDTPLGKSEIVAPPKVGVTGGNNNRVVAVSQKGGTVELFTDINGVKVKGAVGVGPTDPNGIGMDARSMPNVATGSQARVVANNPYIPKSVGGNLTMMDFLPEAARVTQKGGEIVINGNIKNPYFKVPTQNELSKLGLRIKYQGDLHSDYQNNQFRRVDGSLIDKNTIKSVIFEKVR